MERFQVHQALLRILLIQKVVLVVLIVTLGCLVGIVAVTKLVERQPTMRRLERLLLR